jgi:hypothetical protein
MSEKTSGVDFDRQAFVPPDPVPSRSNPQLTGLVLALVAIAAIALIGYKLLPRSPGAGSADDPAIADIDKRLTSIEERLERVETARPVSMPRRIEEQQSPAEPAPAKPAGKTVYNISPPPAQRATPSGPDPATAQRLSTLQQGLGALQNNQAASQAANQEAWQATTNKLADMAGQVGSQGVDILRSQDELNQLLARTQMEAIPFELLRRSNPQPVGPVSLVLKTSNPKTERYTLCVLIQSTCIELKDRTLHEVVQFVVSRNTPPLEVIATKITKDEMLGYLEVPKSMSGH